MIKKIQTLLTTAVLLFGMGGSSFADFNDGFDAYNKGDYKTAFNEWKSLAEQGDADAQDKLGLMYENGRGTLKDYKESFKWYHKAAEQGNPSAQQYLGFLYASGYVVTKDLTKAKYWTKKAYDNPNVTLDTLILIEMLWDAHKLWKY